MKESELRRKVLDKGLVNLSLSKHEKSQENTTRVVNSMIAKFFLKIEPKEEKEKKRAILEIVDFFKNYEEKFASISRENELFYKEKIQMVKGYKTYRELQNSHVFGDPKATESIFNSSPKGNVTSERGGREIRSLLKRLETLKDFVKLGEHYLSCVLDWHIHYVYRLKIVPCYEKMDITTLSDGQYLKMQEEKFDIQYSNAAITKELVDSLTTKMNSLVNEGDFAMYRPYNSFMSDYVKSVGSSVLGLSTPLSFSFTAEEKDKLKEEYMSVLRDVASWSEDMNTIIQKSRDPSGKYTSNNPFYNVMDHVLLEFGFFGPGTLSASQKTHYDELLLRFVILFVRYCSRVNDNIESNSNNSGVFLPENEQTSLKTLEIIHGFLREVFNTFSLVETNEDIARKHSIMSKETIDSYFKTTSPGTGKKKIRCCDSCNYLPEITNEQSIISVMRSIGNERKPFGEKDAIRDDVKLSKEDLWFLYDASYGFLKGLNIDESQTTKKFVEYLDRVFREKMKTIETRPSDELFEPSKIYKISNHFYMKRVYSILVSCYTLIEGEDTRKLWRNVTSSGKGSLVKSYIESIQNFMHGKNHDDEKEESVTMGRMTNLSALPSKLSKDSAKLFLTGFYVGNGSNLMSYDSQLFEICRLSGNLSILGIMDSKIHKDMETTNKKYGTFVDVMSEMASGMYGNLLSRVSGVVTSD